MAIVRTVPEMDVNNLPELPEGSLILIDSDAPTNAQAILEVERWCRANGLWRAQEANLACVRLNGEPLRRAHCYRPYRQEIEEGLEEAKRADSELSARVAAEPMGRSSVDIVREVRGAVG